MRIWCSWTIDVHVLRLEKTPTESHGLDYRQQSHAESGLQHAATRSWLSSIDQANLLSSLTLGPSRVTADCRSA